MQRSVNNLVSFILTFPITHRHTYTLYWGGRKEGKKRKNDEKWGDYREERYQKIRVYPLNDNKRRADTVCRSIDITGYDLGKWRNRGVPPLANGKRIPRTILVHHVSDTSPFDCIVALPSFCRRKEGIERLGNGNTTSNSRSCDAKIPVNSRESPPLLRRIRSQSPQKLYQFLRNFPPLTSRREILFSMTKTGFGFQRNSPLPLNLLGFLIRGLNCETARPIVIANRQVTKER